MNNLRAFDIKFLGATDTRGARVSINDLRHDKKIIISYDYEFNSIYEIAKNHLEKIGIKILYCVESKKGYILLTDDFATQIINKHNF